MLEVNDIDCVKILYLVLRYAAEGSLCYIPKIEIDSPLPRGVNAGLVARGEAKRDECRDWFNELSEEPYGAYYVLHILYHFGIISKSPREFLEAIRFEWKMFDNGATSRGDSMTTLLGRNHGCKRRVRTHKS